MATTLDASALRPRPVDYLATLVGALGISTAPVLVVLSQAHPTPIGVWRFIYALPLLVPLCLLRRESRLAFRRRGWMALAGLSGLLMHGIGANTFIIVRIMEPLWLIAGLVVASTMFYEVGAITGEADAST